MLPLGGRKGQLIDLNFYYFQKQCSKLFLFWAQGNKTFYIHNLNMVIMNVCPWKLSLMFPSKLSLT